MNLVNILNAVGIQYEDNYFKVLGKYDIKKGENRPIVVSLSSPEKR